MARQYPQVDYWEGYNECYSAKGEGIEKYAEMEADRILALAGVGAKAAAFCFSCGRPPVGIGDAGNDQWAAWRACLPTLRILAEFGGVLLLHEYDAPYMTRSVIGNIWDPRATGWLCLRYRMVANWLQTNGISLYHPETNPRGLKIALGETGIDGGVTAGRTDGHPGGGWADFKDYPDPLLGDYAQQRKWYAWQVSNDRYVVGLTSFGENSVDPTWHSFSALFDTGMTDKIIQAESTLPLWHHAGGPAVPNMLDSTMLAEGAAHQTVKLNPNAAIQRVILNDGFVPTSGEFDVTYGGVSHVAQRAERLDTGEVRVYYAAKGDWGNVRHASKP